MDSVTQLITALLASVHQTNRLLRLHTIAGVDVLIAESLAGWEAVGLDGFCLEMDALSTDASVDIAALVGTPVLIELMTATGQLRPFHGHLTAMERLGSNGGLARYRCRIEPWLSTLRYRQDSYAFHDMTVMEIVESVFADYQGQGMLTPAWRWQLADSSVYLKRSLTTQYQESDLAFVQRLLAEEGLFGWFEHVGDANATALGSHVWVLTDHNGAFAPQPGVPVRFHGKSGVQPEDSIQQWQQARRWQTNVLTRSSWDYRTLSMRPATAVASTLGELALEDRDPAGAYAYATTEQGERRARQHLDALQVASCTIDGASNLRTMSPGLRFVLREHTSVAGLDDEAASFVCLRVQHHARSNLHADIHAGIEDTLGVTDLPTMSLPEAWQGIAGAMGTHHATGKGWTDDTSVAEAGIYQNNFTALPAAQTYRPQTSDGHGQRLQPKPSVIGAQSAIVVGAGAPAHTDRDHRIKVQFHWQRGNNASSGQAHPAGEDNAPGTSDAGTWVRVVTPLAGANWGSHLLPRVGQEVLVHFLEGDIDRPVIIGALYNGTGQPDAAHNQIGGGGANATGNAVAWFAGNEHAAVMSGFKTQSLAASQSGSGGYNQLLFDDSAGQGRVQLMSTQTAAALNLGHLKGGRDNVRGADRGFGAELSTQASGAVRAGAGLLLSTEPGDCQLAANAAVGALSQAQQLVTGLLQAAQAALAKLPNEATPEQLPTVLALKASQTALKVSQSGENAGDGIGGGEGEVPAWSEPNLVLSSPAGIAAMTPASQLWCASEELVLSADLDVNWLAQGEFSIAAAQGIGLYTVGLISNAKRPNQETGIKLHAATGPVSVQAQANEAKLAAAGDITLASAEGAIQITASKQVIVTAAGAYLKLDGGNIELGAPGTIAFKAGQHVLTGPQSAQASLPHFPKAALSLPEEEKNIANDSTSVRW